ncbi:MAG: ribonuclease E/G [Paracoccaceae bacterium]
MIGSEILLGAVQGREAAAWVEDGQLQDLLIDGDAPRPGTIYRAKATRPMKGQGGMFLTTPDGTAFLRGVKGIAPGDMLLVQVTGYAESGKAIPVTAKVLFKSRYVIVTPEAPGINISRAIRDEEQRLAIRAAAETELAETSGYGLILRSACADADPDAIGEDVDTMIGLAQAVLSDTGTGVEKLSEGSGPHELAWRDWPSEAPRDADLAEYVDAALSDFVQLKGGASFWVEATRACITVDVNTGGDSSMAAGLKANIATAQALPAALRTRGLGGQIVVDFAPMPKRDRAALESVLRAALRKDDIETALVGWTAMGLYELNRKRARLPLREILR